MQFNGSAYTFPFPIYLPNGTAAAPSLAFASDPTKGMYSSGSNQIAWAIGGVQNLLLSSSTGLTVLNGYIGPNIYGNGNGNSGLILGGAVRNDWGINATTGNIVDLGTHTITAGGQIASGGLTTVGLVGVPNVTGSGRSTAQTAAVASVAAYTVGAADGTFEVSANVDITTFVAGTFTVTCAYTDENSSARTLTLNFSNSAGAVTTAVAAADSFANAPLTIRCKAATAITIATAGTFTSLTYNVSGLIKQVA